MTFFNAYATAPVFWSAATSTTTMITRRALSSLRRAPLARGLSSRATAVLSALDIRPDTELHGVYDGEWTGSGEVFESVCPTTGEVLARVKSVCVVIYARCCVRPMSSVSLGHAFRAPARVGAFQGGV